MPLGSTFTLRQSLITSGASSSGNMDRICFAANNTAVESLGPSDINMMYSCMITMFKNHEIFRFIVKRISVNVMDVFRRIQLAANKIFYNGTVLIFPSFESRDLYNPVSYISAIVKASRSYRFLMSQVRLIQSFKSCYSNLFVSREISVVPFDSPGITHKSIAPEIQWQWFSTPAWTNSNFVLLKFHSNSNQSNRGYHSAISK